MAPVKVSNSGEGDAGAEKNRSPDTDPMKDVSWSGIFAQHETNLKAHLKIIGMVKEHVAEGSDSFSTVCGMVDRTKELMKQLETLRNEFVPRHTARKILGLGPGSGRKRVAPDADTEDATRPGSSKKRNPGSANDNGLHGVGKPAFVFDSKPTLVDVPEQPRRRKRSRGEDGKIILEERNDAVTPPSGKRAKTKSHSRSRERPKNMEKNDATTTPIPVETEDISAEVEARLMIREANRQRKDEGTKKKRKRESMNSNAEEGASGTRKPKKKKPKKGEGRESEVESNGSGRSKKEEKDRRLRPSCTKSGKPPG